MDVLSSFAPKRLAVQDAALGSYGAMKDALLVQKGPRVEPRSSHAVSGGRPKLPPLGAE